MCLAGGGRGSCYLFIPLTFLFSFAVILLTMTMKRAKMALISLPCIYTLINIT